MILVRLKISHPASRTHQVLEIDRDDSRIHVMYYDERGLFTGMSSIKRAELAGYLVTHLHYSRGTLEEIKA